MRIVIGDLRHNTLGKHSAYMPIAIGYIACFIENQMGFSEGQVSIHTKVDDIASVIAKGSPDIVGLSNYIWNAELSAMLGRRIKEVSPSTIIVGGGPEFPTSYDEIMAYLNYRHELDFFVNNYEGESSFLDLVKAINDGESLSDIKSVPPPGVVCLDSGGRLNRGATPVRLLDLDVIPSPILTGTMDRYLKGDYMPFVETTRGCPYSCTYCVQGTSWFNKIAVFSTQRIAAELEYIAQRMRAFPDIPLALADSNFGMYPRDEETADIVRRIQEQYGWPRSFIVDVGKSQLQRLVRVGRKLQGSLVMSLSPQSLNPATLKAIKRTNLGHGDFGAVYEEFKRNGLSTYACIIVPLPEETIGSYTSGLRKLSELDVQETLPYTTMMLKGTELATQENRQKYGMITKYRMLPRQLGDYFGKRVFEYDEVCVATNTMTFDEYVDCRSLVFTFLVLSKKQFDILKLHCNEYGLDWFDFMLAYWRAAINDVGAVGDVYEKYIQSTSAELFDTPEHIRRFVEDDNNYKAIIAGDIGENVIRKFAPQLVFDSFAEAISLGYDILEKFRPEKVTELENARAWTLATRDIAKLLRGEPDRVRRVALDYDVLKWYREQGGRPLCTLCLPVIYDLTADVAGIEQAVASMHHLYGSRGHVWVSRLLEAKPIEEFWRMPTE